MEELINELVKENDNQIQKLQNLNNQEHITRIIQAAEAMAEFRDGLNVQIFKENLIAIESKMNVD